MTIEYALLLIAAPVFAFALFRGAALGWYGVKLRYQRRLIATHKGERQNGKPAGQ